MQQMDFNLMDQTQSNNSKWAMRSIVAYVLIGIFLALFIILRLISCDSFQEVMYASVLGLIIGIIFFKVNLSLFGIESINFLGLPYMVNKNEVGAPIYVCAPTNPK
jgi:cell shape-determining protein MreD